MSVNVCLLTVEETFSLKHQFNKISNLVGKNNKSETKIILKQDSNTQTVQKEC